MCRFRIFVLILLASPAWIFAALKPGDAMPDLKTFELEGALPAKLQGRVILLDFWASWCVPCKASFPAMHQLQKRFGDQGFTILAVSVDDTREAMERFLKKNAVAFTVLRDAKQKLVSVADVQTMPTSFLIDRSGKIRFMHVGFEGETTAKEYADEIEKLLKEPK